MSRRQVRRLVLVFLVALIATSCYSENTDNDLKKDSRQHDYYDNNLSSGSFIEFHNRHIHRRNNRRDQGRLVPPTFRLGEGDQRCIGPPNFLAVVFKKQEISQQVVARMHDLASEFSEIFRGWYPRTLTADPLLHPTLSAAFGWARGVSAPVLGPKPWSSSTFQPWLRPWSYLSQEVNIVSLIHVYELYVVGAFKKFVAWRSWLLDTHIIFCHFST